MSGHVPQAPDQQQSQQGSLHQQLPSPSLLSMRQFSGSSSLSVAAADLEDSVMYRDKRLFMVAFPSFERIRRQGKLCDITLRVGPAKFSAHRVVLAASIPFFYGMFMHDMKESSKGEVEMQGLEAQALELLINFAYTGEVQITCENVQELFSGSSYLQVPNVKEACVDFMRARLSVCNVAEVCRFVMQFDCQPLVANCQNFMAEHFHQLVAADEFKSLSLEEVSDLLSRDDLRVSSEEEVYQAGLRWLRHRQQERQAVALSILRCIRLTQLPTPLLADISKDPVFRNSLECRDLLDEAKEYFLLPERRLAAAQQLQQQQHQASSPFAACSFRSQPRSCLDACGFIYAVGGLTSSGDSISTVECYDPVKRHWRVAENMTTHRSRVGVAVLNGRLYAIGGYDGKDRLNTVEVFDPCANQWRRVAPMNCKRSALGAAALVGKLYVCGGYDGVSSLRSCEVYWPERDQWHMMPNMADCRSAGGVVALDNQLYALGGHNGLAIYETVERLNPVDPVWRPVAPMLNRRCRHGVSALNGKIYVAGGYNGVNFLNTVELYNPATNEWTLTSALKTSRSRVALTATWGKLYAIGGYDGIQNLSSVEVYDEESKVWSEAPQLTAHEGGVGVGVLPPRTPTPFLSGAGTGVAAFHGNGSGGSGLGVSASAPALQLAASGGLGANGRSATLETLASL